MNEQNAGPNHDAAYWINKAEVFLNELYARESGTFTPPEGLTAQVYAELAIAHGLKDLAEEIRAQRPVY
jgi:hypothetical protein